MKQQPSRGSLLLCLFVSSVLLLNVVVHGQTTTTTESWTGCVSDPANNPSTDRIKIGQSTFICLQIGNSVNWSQPTDYMRFSFTPRADTYSRFHIPNSYSDLTAGSTSNPTIWTGKQITVSVSSQTGLSFLRIYFDPNTAKVYPHLTAIINVKDGIVTGITWDDACIFCNAAAQCDEITYNFNGVQQTQETSGQPTGGCYVAKSDCDAAMGTSTACDLLLYVVWTGTDVEGRALLSSANRFSAFPIQEIQNRLLNNLPEFSISSIPGI